ncbi:MAG: MFS transporter [Chitinophagaceae bacterium]|nr:MFS transporter [Chitinophagaceae bacterium]
MPHLKIRISIFINYFLFAILLNSVGTVILQVQRYFSVTESSAALLEAFKDISIAAVSFLVASFITRIGYKKSMLIALGLMSVTCFIIPLVKTFIAVKLLFAITGVCFALTKVSVFGTIGLITKDEKGHLSLMNLIESFFMVGILAGYFIFSYYIDDKDAGSSRWFNVYYVLGVLSIIAFFLLLSAPLNESAAKADHPVKLKEDVAGMLKLIVLPVVVSFVVCAFVYVLLEQSIMSWLPTFNNKVLQLPSTLSIQITSILAASTAAGRLLAAMVLKKISWFTVLSCCLLFAAGLVLIALPLAGQSAGKNISGWADVPLAAYIFPFIGFFLAPVYPAINSVILSSLPKHQHGMMAGLIVVFSALGGTLGSIITGFIFQHYGGQTAFYFSLVPVAVLLLALMVFKRMKRNPAAVNNSTLATV